jgi:hypothetical protein
VLPDFAFSDSPRATPPTFGKVVKEAAVQALFTHSRRNPSLKPLCDRVYSRFFQSFDEWQLRQRKRARRPPAEAARIDDRAAAEVRRKFAALTAEAAVWAAAAPAVPIAVPPIAEEEEEEPEAAADARAIEDAIFELDAVAQRVSVHYALGQTADLVGQELAARMRDAAEDAPAILKM